MTNQQKLRKGKKAKLEKIRRVLFSVVVVKEDGEWETQPTPFVYLGELDKPVKLKIYEGEEGQELYVKTYKLKDIKSNIDNG